jgi:hypothetical protein
MFSSCILRLSYGVAVAFWFCLLVCSFALPAHAYVDPGTGLFVFQMLTTTLAGITFMLRKRIRELFERFSGDSTKDSDDIAER